MFLSLYCLWTQMHGFSKLPQEIMSTQLNSLCLTTSQLSSGRKADWNRHKLALDCQKECESIFSQFLMKFNSYRVQVFKWQKSASMTAIHSATVMASTINGLLFYLEVCKQSEEYGSWQDYSPWPFTHLLPNLQLDIPRCTTTSYSKHSDMQEKWNHVMAALE